MFTCSQTKDAPLLANFRTVLDKFLTSVYGNPKLYLHTNSDHFQALEKIVQIVAKLANVE